MTETAHVRIFLPISGVEKNVEILAEENAYTMVKDQSGKTVKGYQVTYREPDYLGEDKENWFEIDWSMERTSGNETTIESDGELRMTCPNCGRESTVRFTQKEFEELESFCNVCGEDITVIRDQPTESGQSHVINYTAHLF